MNFDNFYKNGFQVINADNLSKMEEIRKDICKCIRDLIDEKVEDDEFLINNLHDFKKFKNLSDGEFNEKRSLLIGQVNNGFQITESIYKAFKTSINFLLGPDILGQKFANITIQKPLDNYPTCAHRDSPPNSHYEIVIWAPMTDAYSTKSMSVVPKEQSKLLANSISESKSMVEFTKNASDICYTPKVDFGQALLFHPSLFHLSHTNEEKETRLSLNIRFKNLYSPFGLKDPGLFFSPIEISAVTKLAYEFEILENKND